MLTVQKLDKALSIKLGDPRSDNGDGEIFTLDLRLGYIQRAVSKLFRDLPLLMSTYAPLFSQNNVLHVQEIGVSGKSSVPGLLGTLPPIASGDKLVIGSYVGNGIVTKSLDSVEEVFVEIKKSGTIFSTEKATFVRSQKYLSMVNEGADGYAPSFPDKSIFYAILDNKICLIPLVTSEYEYSKISLVMKAELSELTLASTLPISTEYEDLLLSMSALEGMQDLGRTDKVGIYGNEVNSQLQVLQGYASYKIKSEGSDLNG